MNLIEPDYLEPFTAWKTQPGPPTASSLLRAINPDIDRAIQANVGKPTPALRGHAKRLALDVLQRYDPNQSKLGTYLTNQFRSLRRVNARQQQVIKLPERLSLQWGQLQRAEKDLEDELGRPPIDDEISDRLGIPHQRLAMLRRTHMPLTETQLGDSSLTATRPDNSQRAIMYAYDDLGDPLNRKILEWTTGMNGQQRLSNQDIAARLGITPSAVTQRKKTIQAKIDLALGLLDR